MLPFLLLISPPSPCFCPLPPYLPVINFLCTVIIVPFVPLTVFYHHWTRKIIFLSALWEAPQLATYPALLCDLLTGVYLEEVWSWFTQSKAKTGLKTFTSHSFLTLFVISHLRSPKMKRGIEQFSSDLHEMILFIWYPTVAQVPALF